MINPKTIEVSIKRVAPWKRDSDAWKLVLTKLFQTLILYGFTKKSGLRVQDDLNTDVVDLMNAAKSAHEYGFYGVDFNSTVTRLLVADANNFLKFGDFGFGCNIPFEIKLIKLNNKP